MVLPDPPVQRGRTVWEEDQESKGAYGVSRGCEGGVFGVWIWEVMICIYNIN